MRIDIKRGEPRIDPTMGRRRCQEHGEAAQSYVGYERYECWHCAVAEYQRLTAEPEV